MNGDSSGFRAKMFPYRKRGVLLPVHDRRAAALGICMFTASKPKVLALQVAAYWTTRLVGARLLPGRAEHWTSPYTRDVWSELIETWRRLVGHFDALAVYQRRQAERDGLTILLMNSGSGMAVVKVRLDGISLAREQDALAAVTATRPVSFRAPEPLGGGSSGDGVHWSAQTSVFDRPHRPRYQPPSQLFAEVGQCLSAVPGSTIGAGRVAHNDLTPWNLRLDHRGRTWLYDWEDWGQAPLDADLTYFSATAHALTGSAMPSGLPDGAIDFWCARVSAREHFTSADRRLNHDILAGLANARRRAPRSP